MALNAIIVVANFLDLDIARAFWLILMDVLVEYTDLYTSCQLQKKLKKQAHGILPALHYFKVGLKPYLNVAANKKEFI